MKRKIISLGLIVMLSLMPLQSALAYWTGSYIPNGEVKNDPLMNVTNPGLSEHLKGVEENAEGIPLGEFTVNPLTGAGVYHYPLTLPPGRKGIEPELFLEYNNQSKNNFSHVGYGWELSQSYIKRSDRQGVNHLYDNSNEFELQLFGEGGTLVPISLIDSTHGTYGKQIEDTFYGYEFQSNNTWVITDQNGVQYTFGSTAATRQVDPTSATRIYKWMLEEVRDLHDNYIRYDYFKNQEDIYLEDIFYTGHGAATPANDGPFEVHLNYETRPDDMVNYRPGFRTVTANRLTDITVEIDGGPAQRTWTLNYTSGDNTIRSLLASITMSSTNEDSTSVTLSPTTFEYSSSHPDGTIDWYNAAMADPFDIPIELIQSNGEDIGNRVMDANGDSWTDFVANNIGECDSGSPPCVLQLTENPTAFINNQNDAPSSSETWVADSSYNNIPDLIQNERTTIIDINGDAFPDYYNPSYYNLYYDDGFLLNNHPNWSDPWGSFADTTLDMGYRYFDVNGDGWDDRVNHTASLPTPSGGYVAFNDGMLEFQNDTSWTLPVPTTFWTNYPAGPNVPLDNGVRFGDINGDGLTDIVQSLHYTDLLIPSTSGNYIALYLNNGQNGWTQEIGWDMPMNPWFFATIERNYYSNWSGSSEPNRCLADLNADGLLDWNLWWNTHYFSKGSGWLQNSIATQNPPECGSSVNWNSVYSEAQRMMDLNADGFLDEINTHTQSFDTWSLSAEELPDLLTTIENPRSGTVDITYTMSGEYQDTSDNLLNPDLPINISTVSHVVRDNGFGETITTDYTYSDGRYYRYDTLRSEFAGFETVTETTDGQVRTYTFDLGCETGDTCSHPLYLPHTILNNWVVDGNYRREIWWPLFETVYRVFDRHKIQVVDPAIVNVLPIGAPWADWIDDYMYDVDLSNYARKGKLLSEEISDTSGNIYRKNAYQWEVADLAGERFFPKKTRDVSMDYEGLSTHRDRATDYTYSNTNGRVTSVYDRGEVTVNPTTLAIINNMAGDERTTNTTYWTYPSNGLVKPDVITRLNQAGNQIAATNHNYNNQGVLTQKLEWQNSPSSWLTTTYGNIDAYGLPHNQTNPRNFTTTFNYDPYNQFVASITNPLGHTNTSTYHYLSGKVATQIDENGYTWITTYDALGRPKTQSVPHPSTGVTTLLSNTTYYDITSPAYQVTTTTIDSVTSTSRLYIDGFGRPLQLWQPAEGSAHNLTDLWYDNRGNIEQQSLPYSSTSAVWSGRNSANPAITRTYDIQNRLLAETYPVGTTTHNYGQWTETITDPNSHLKDYERNAYGKLIEVEEHNNAAVYTSIYGYDALDRLTQRIDENGNIQNFTYDSLGRKLTHQNLHAPSASFGTWSYTYDGSGNRLTQTAPSGQVIGWDYDALDRITAQDENNDSINEVTYTYDNAAVNGLGRLTNVNASGLTVALAYDKQGNISQETKTIGGTPYLTNTTHDLLGRETVVVYPGGVMSVTSTYNAMNTLETLLKDSSETIVADMDYSPAGQISFMEFGNGVTTTNTYNPNENFRLTSKVTVGIFENDPDGDGDGVPDSLDLCPETTPINSNDTVNAQGCALSQLDTDGDTLNNYQEIYVYATNPALADTDGDGLNDGDEINVYFTDPLDTDTDEDGLTDGDEVNVYATNPTLYDTDGNGLPDSVTSRTLTLDPYSPNPTEDTTLIWTGNANMTLIDPALATVGLTGVEYMVSGDTSISWTSTTPSDGAFDSLNEDYTVTIGPLPAPGTYTLSVRLVSFVGSATLYTNQTADTVNIFAEEEIEEAPELFVDSDGDLLSNSMEAELGTNPLIWDTDGNGLPDSILGVANTLDPYEPDPTLDTLLNYTGFASLTFPFFGWPPEDLYISNVEFVIDLNQNPSAVWTGATPTDGPAFDVSTEPYTFITPELSPGPHEITTRVEITVGSTIFTYGEDTDTVTILDSSSSPLSMPEEPLESENSPSDFLLPEDPKRDPNEPNSEADTDGDGLPDFKEKELGTDPFNPDSDHDGLTDGEEVEHGSDPLNPDTDGDGVNDGEEVKQGSNPLLRDQNLEIKRTDEKLLRRTMGALLRQASAYPIRWLTSLQAAAIITRHATTTRSFRWLTSFLIIPLTHATPVSGDIQDLSYTYDNVGNITQIIDSSITPTSKTMNYGYDDLNRLTSASSSGFSEGDFSRTYTHNPLGNMTYKSDVGTMVYNGTGNPTPHAPTQVNGVPYSYDLNGNLLSDGVNTYTWTLKNELASVTTSSGTWTYTYDPGGTRLTSTDPDGNTTTYINPLMEMRPDGPVYYIYGAGQRLARVTGDLTVLGGELAYLHPDHLGSTAVTTDETGIVAELLDYYPYGDELSSSASYSPTPETPYTFGGKEHTEDTGLSYFEARHYQPSTGHFISQDPFPRRAPDFMLPDPQSWNSYAYARNNPMAYTDPSGEFVETAWDAGWVTYDIATKDWGSLAFDAVALVVPVLPAGLTHLDDAGKVGMKMENKVNEVVSAIQTKIKNTLDSTSQKLNDILKNGKLSNSKPNLENWEKGGGLEQAKKDFDKFSNSRTKNFGNKDQYGRTAPLLDTKGSASIRNFSSKNQTTVQINQSNSPKIKIRYKD